MSRLGRGRPAQGFVPSRGLPLDIQSGSTSTSGGGTVTPGVFTRSNYVQNPSFEVDAANWSTSAFSLASGSSIVRDTSNGPYVVGSAGAVVQTSALNQGICAAAPDLGTFTAGTQYWSRVSVFDAGFGDMIEVVFGSAADDFASTVITGGPLAWQTVDLAWTPAADRSASNHGIAIRIKSTQDGTFHAAFLVDAVSIGPNAAYIDGSQTGARWLGTPNESTSRLGGGKTVGRTTSASGGGSTQTSTLQSSATDSTASTGGGSLATTGTKGALLVLKVSGGGTVAATGSSTQNVGFLPPPMLGGGGRIGRSHPVVGLAQAGMVPTAQAGTTSRTGTVTGTAGGTVTTSALKGGAAGTVDHAGGSLATTGIKATSINLVMSGGGTLTLSGGAAPAPGNIVGGMMLMGGGGRVGRSHPASSGIAHTQPRLAPGNLDARTGTVASTGGGGIATAGSKGGISTTPVSIPAPPPELVDILLLPGVLIHGAGQITTSYTRSAGQVGSVAFSGGGTIRTTATKAATGSTTASSGGTLALAVKKNGLGATTATGGGSIATSFILGISFTDHTAVSGGGTPRTIGAKNGLGTLAMSGGGTVRTTAAKKTTGTVSMTGGGILTLIGSQFGPQVSDVAQVHGGGTVNTTAGKNSTGTVTVTGGGSGSETHSKHASGVVQVTGGGNLRTVRVNVAIPIYRGLVGPTEDKGLPVLLRR